MRRPTAALLALALVGCGSIAPTCDQPITIGYGDADGDGWGNENDVREICGPPVATDVTRAGDCDDQDASIYPGASELCDGVDRDCNGAVDDGPDRYERHRDEDGDGYGDPNPVPVCPDAVGYVDNDFDCNDADPQINPDNPEVCNGVDDDCDGLADDDDPDTDPSTMQQVYADLDGDGWGDDLNWQLRCDAAGNPNVVAQGGDCNDADPDVNPDADEVCGGGDEDCDGLIDSADPSLDPAGTTVYWTDGDGDGYGQAGAQVLACGPGPGLASNPDDCDDGNAAIGAPDDWLLDSDGDGYGAGAVVGTGCSAPYAGTVQAWLGTDCDDGNADRFPGNPEVCDDGIDQDCSGSDQSCMSNEFAIGGTTSSWTLSSYFRGHVFLPSQPVTLDYFRWHLGLASTCALDFYVHTGPTASGPWTTVWSGSGSYVGDDFHESPAIGITMNPGTYYGMGVAWNCSATYYAAPGSAGPYPLGTFVHTYWDNSYGSYSPTYVPPNVGSGTGTVYDSEYGYTP